MKKLKKYFHFIQRYKNAKLHHKFFQMLQSKKLIILGLLMVIIGHSCKRNDSFVDDFDHAAQALKDNDSLVDFFKHIITMISWIL